MSWNLDELDLWEELLVFLQEHLLFSVFVHDNIPKDSHLKYILSLVPRSVGRLRLERRLRHLLVARRRHHDLRQLERRRAEQLCAGTLRRDRQRRRVERPRVRREQSLRLRRRCGLHCDWLCFVMITFYITFFVICQ